MGLGAHRRRNAVGAKYENRRARYDGEVLDEPGATGLEAVDDVAVVDDLVTYVDRRSKLIENPVDDLDRVGDAGTKPPRACDQYALFLWWTRHGRVRGSLPRRYEPNNFPLLALPKHC